MVGGLGLANSPNLSGDQKLATLQDKRHKHIVIRRSEIQFAEFAISIFLSKYLVIEIFSIYFHSKDKSNTLDFIYYRKLLTLVIGVDTRADSAK